MEESKGFKVQISFTDHSIQGIQDSNSLSLQATINQNSHLLQYQTPASITMPSFSPESVMVLQLCIYNEQIAAAIVQLGRLCGKTLTGDYNKWVRMESKPETSFEAEKIKVRISGSLHAIRKTASKPKGLLGMSPQKKGKCQYLTKLGAVEQAQREIESTLTRVRARLGTEYDDIFERGTRSPLNRSPTGRKTTRTAGRSPLKASRIQDQAFPPEGAFLQLPSRFNLNLQMLSSLQPQLLRNVIVALTQKIQVMKAQVQEHQVIQGVVQAFVNPMKELSQSIEQTKNETTTQNGKINQVLQNVQYENITLKEELDVTLKKIQEAEEEIEFTKSECEESKKINDDLKAHALTDIGLNIQNLRQKIAENEKTSKGLHRAYEQALNQFSRSIQTVDRQRAQLVDQKADVLVQLQQIKAELDQSEIENIQLEGTLSALDATLTSEQDTLSRISLLSNLNDHFQQSNQSLQNSYQSTNTHFKSLTTESTNLNKKIHLDLKDLVSLKISTSKQKTTHQQEKEVCQKSLDEFVNRLNDIKKMLERGQNIYQNYDQIYKEYLAESETLNDVLCQLTYFSDLVFSQAQAGLITQRLSTRLNELLEQKEFQKSSLTRMVDSMQKQKAAYVAREDDKIDKALGSFLNKMQTTPEVNFVRISRGKYKFGLREVTLSLEGSQVMVQFANTKVHLDEFIEGYTEIEKEKIDKEVASRKSPSPTGSPVRAFARSFTSISPARRATFTKQLTFKKQVK